MKIAHRISLSVNEEEIDFLNKIGIDVFNIHDKRILASPNSITKLLVLLLDETSKEYLAIHKHIKAWDAMDIATSIFTENEMDEAKLFVFEGIWANGYPQPEQSFNYRKITYSDKEYCLTCGIGLMQIAPFRLKKEPNWRDKKMFELNWVFDELFVKRDIYEQLFKKFNISYNEVRLYKKETLIENTVQLIIPETTTHLDPEKYPYSICPDCQRKRYEPKSLGYFPSFLDIDSNGLQLYKSVEYFGTGSLSYKKIFMTDELRDELKKYRIKPKFTPVIPRTC